MSQHLEETTPVDVKKNDLILEKIFFLEMRNHPGDRIFTSTIRKEPKDVDHSRHPNGKERMIEF